MVGIRWCFAMPFAIVFLWFLLLTAIVFAIKDYGILDLLNQVCHLNCG